MSITATSPLATISVNKPVNIPLGDGTPDCVWSIPPGSMAPPGMHLNSVTGVLRGVPTIPGVYTFYVRERYPSGVRNQTEFMIEVTNEQGVNQVTLEQLILQAFKLNGGLTGQEVVFSSSIDDQGRKTVAVKGQVNGQVRTIASVVIS